MTRDEVLDVLDKLSPLKRKKLDRATVPVQFIQNRIAIVLPAASYTADERIRLAGKFQYLMTQTKGQHAFLDFADNWLGLDTTMREGLR
jgi:hypothetical protein